jgi:hypothetical protein
MTLRSTERSVASWLSAPCEGVRVLALVGGEHACVRAQG